MKNNLIEEDIIRIKKLIKNVLNERFELIKDDNIITEQVYPLLAKYLGKGVASKLETSMGDDVMKNLEKLFAKKDIFTKGTGENLGKIVIKSASGTEVQMRTISAALNAVAKGDMSANDVLNLLPPGKLQNGTDFATILGDQLKKPKPKLKTTTNTTSGLSTGAGAGTNASTSLMDKLKKLINNRKSPVGGGRYVPTDNDFLDVANSVIALNPEFTQAKISNIVNKTKLITSAKNYDDFKNHAADIILNMSEKFNKPKENIAKYLWQLIKTNKLLSAFIFCIFAPGLAAGLTKGAFSQLNKFIRELSPSISNMLDNMDVSDPRTNKPEGSDMSKYGKGRADEFNSN
jgi:hypothetical protein